MRCCGLAIFHLSAKIVSRGKGQSAVAKAAYNSRDNLENENTGERHDYRRQGEILFSGIFAPKNAPDWVQDRQDLWSAVEKKETRKNSQLAREIEIALPHELTDKQRENLVKDFVRENFVRKGMIADVAIHAPATDGDQRNHHAHILLTMREIGPDGFGEKMRHLNSKAQLEEWRENWARTANRYLDRFYHSDRIDHRSLEAQGIDREPTTHLGPIAAQMEKEGAKTVIGDINRTIEERNRQREELKAQRQALREQERQEREKERELQEKQRAAHKGATLYDRPDMVSTQQDAMRHLKDAHRIEQRTGVKPMHPDEHRQQQERQQQQEQEQNKRKSEEPKNLDQREQAQEDKQARTEQTEGKQRRSAKDLLRERWERSLNKAPESLDRSDRERERERER